MPNVERHLQLDGAVNFRDLGGYATSDDRRLRRGLVFRSDQLADLSDSDLKMVAALGLRTVCDLRADSERLQKPNREFLPPLPAMHAIGFMPTGGDAILGGARALTVADVEHKVTAIYRDMVRNQSASFARLFRLMLAPHAFPLLFHCTSGRDRTGIAALLLLSALGVPRDTITDDYALSDQYRRDLTFQLGNGVAAEVMAALMRAHPAYLVAAFEELDRGWGGIDRYLHEALHVSDAARTHLQALLLEDRDTE